MPANNPDRALLKNLHDLAALTPSEQSPARAIARTRAALEQARPRKNLLTRLAIPAGIAALLIAAAFIFFSLHSPLPASAAEQLNAAIQTTQAYKGWIKLTIELPAHEVKKNPATQLYSSLPSNFEQFACTDGSRAYYIGSDNNRALTLWSTSKKEVFSYNIAANEIRLSDMFDLRMEPVPTPTNLASFLAEQKRRNGRDPLAVKETPDGDLSRFDITLFASPEEAKRAAIDQNMAYLGTSITVWVNHDRLLARMQIKEPTGPIIVNYTYDIPDINTIYDLGIPASAKVIDERLTKDVAKLMDSLDARAKKGFGNYTAFLATYDTDTNNQPTTDTGFLSLYANHDDQWFTADYRLFHKIPPGRKDFPGYVLQSAPPLWPLADFQKILPLLHDSSPTEFALFDGDHGFRGFFDTKTKSYPDISIVPAKEHPFFILQLGLVAKIWPNRLSTEIGFGHIHAEIIQNRERSRLVGLHYVSTSEDRSETTWWLDPTRDEMPVECLATFSYNFDGTISTVRTHTRFLEYAQLPNGQWYPRTWQDDRTETNSATSQTHTSTSHYLLQILPTLILDNSWFQKPAPKFNSPQPLP